LIVVEGLVLFGPQKFVFLGSLACINGQSSANKSVEGRITDGLPITISWTVSSSHGAVFGFDRWFVSVEHVHINGLTLGHFKASSELFILLAVFNFGVKLSAAIRAEFLCLCMSLFLRIKWLRAL